MCSYIFIVPLGPKFDFITSEIPFAAVILTAKAWAALATSAFGFNKLIAIFFDFTNFCGTSTQKPKMETLTDSCHYKCHESRCLLF